MGPRGGRSQTPLSPAPASVQRSSTAADGFLARAPHQRGGPPTPRRACHLAGRHDKVRLGPPVWIGTPISSLHYSANLFEESPRRRDTDSVLAVYVALKKAKAFQQNELWAIPRPDFGKVKCDRRETKPGMLWVDRVGDRRSGVTWRGISKENGEQRKKQENEQERKKPVSLQEKLKDENMRKTETETMLNMNRAP